MTRPVDHQRIILLERTLTDFDHQPKTATGAAIARNTKAEAKEGNEETILCRDCGGEGEKRIRTVVQPCPTCKGRGAEVVDQYTGRRLRTETQEIERFQRMYRCSSCGGSKRGPWWRNGDELDDTCRRCWGSGYEPGPDQPARPFRGVPTATDLGPDDPVVVALELGMRGAGKAYQRRQEAGSYESLGLALGALRIEHRHLYQLNAGVFIAALREEDDLTGSELFLLEASLVYIRKLMPAEIRVPSYAEQYEERRRERVLKGEEAA